jgi:hypothetical protein
MENRYRITRRIRKINKTKMLYKLLSKNIAGNIVPDIVGKSLSLFYNPVAYSCYTAKLSFLPAVNLRSIEAFIAWLI